MVASKNFPLPGRNLEQEQSHIAEETAKTALKWNDKELLQVLAEKPNPNHWLERQWEIYGNRNGMQILKVDIITVFIAPHKGFQKKV